MAVQRQAGFEPQAVAGAQADRLDAGVFQDGVPDALCLIRRHRNLIAVLAGIARTRDVAVDAEQHQPGAFHEAHLGQDRLMRGHDFGGFRPLDGDQGAVQHGQLGVAFEVCAPEGEILVLVAGVDDDEQAVVIRAAGHQVVDDPAVLVQQQRILLLAGLQDFIVAGHEPLELGGRVLAGDLALAHVRHVEQAGVFAGPAVLGQDALILDRHVIAAEAHHPGSQSAVRGVQGRGLQGLVGHGSGFHGRVWWRSSAVFAPPLS